MSETPTLDFLEQFKCDLCGCRGLHACMGAPSPGWTGEELKELKRMLEEMFSEDTDSVFKYKFGEI